MDFGEYTKKKFKSIKIYSMNCLKGELLVFYTRENSVLKQNELSVYFHLVSFQNNWIIFESLSNYKSKITMDFIQKI